MTNARLGIRPDARPFNPGADPCAQLKDMVDYSQVLQEAYHTRATQNRFWIYGAGTVALGTVAATGGLGAAGAAALSIALVSLSGGFTAGVFALINNSALADVYTISANKIAEAIGKARLATSSAECGNAYKVLVGEVTAAQTELERARTDSAMAAAIRAKAQLEQLQQLAASITTTTTTSSTTTSLHP